MPPERVAPNGGTRSQGGAVQIGSERAWQRRAGCERADCDTNNARVDHSESGVCASSRQFLLQDDVSSGKTARSEEAPSRNWIRGRTELGRGKNGLVRVLAKSRFVLVPGRSF